MIWFLVLCFGSVHHISADITGTDPPTGSCLCVSGTAVNVRDSPCGNVIGQVSTGSCFKYTGSKTTCILSGVSYEFFGLEYGANGGYLAGTYLNLGSDSQCSVATGCPNIVTRAEWGARPPTSVSYISHPIPKVFIHHTETGTCTDQASCSAIVRSIQDYHMDSNGWSDIGYNFLVGEDGNAYEGRGWDVIGAHASNWNSVALGISTIGSYMTRVPNDAALTVNQQLISCGTGNGKVSASYTLHGHRDGGCTDCPGDAFYSLIQTWPHYGGSLGGCVAGQG